MHWVETLPNGLRGKKRQAAVRKQRKLHIGPDGWNFLADLVSVLKVNMSSLLRVTGTQLMIYQPFKEFTLTLSKQKVPTLPQLLVLYKHLEQHLNDSRADPRFSSPNSQKALKLAQDKLQKHLSIAQSKKYILLAAGKFVSIYAHNLVADMQ